MLNDGLLLMNDAFKERVGTSESPSFSVVIFSGEEKLLDGNFVSLMHSQDSSATIVFTTSDFWKAIELSNNIKECSNLYIKLNNEIITSTVAENWNTITVERLGQSARVTLSSYQYLGELQDA